jgi:lipoate-protein ligase A
MTSEPRAWLRWEDSPRDAAANMATDTALLEFAGALAKPVIRFYEWNHSAATFGYFQRYADVETVTSLRPLIRRPTGGGVVPHDGDWTYSVTVPPAHSWYALTATESYARIHGWIRDAFKRLGLATGLAPERRGQSQGLCFVGAERFDLIWQDRKLAGAAQRRNLCGLLIQGSIQPVPPGLPREAWRKAMCDQAEEAWGVQWIDFEWKAGMTSRVEELVSTRYSADSYNRRR